MRAPVAVNRSLVCKARSVYFYVKCIYLTEVWQQLSLKIPTQTVHNKNLFRSSSISKKLIDHFSLNSPFKCSKTILHFLLLSKQNEFLKLYFPKHALRKKNWWNLYVDTPIFKCIFLSAKYNFCWVSVCSIMQTLNSCKGKSNYKADWSLNLADQCNNPFCSSLEGRILQPATTA